MASWLEYKLQHDVWQTQEEPRSAKHNYDGTNGKRLRPVVLQKLVEVKTSLERNCVDAPETA